MLFRKLTKVYEQQWTFIDLWLIQIYYETLQVFYLRNKITVILSSVLQYNAEY